MSKKSNVKKRKLAFTHTKIGAHPSSTRVGFNYSTWNANYTSSTSQATKDDQFIVNDTPAAHEIPVDLGTSSGCENTSTNRKMREINAWQQLRPKLREAYFETVVPTTSDICCTCGETTTEPVVCMECTSRKVLCEQCALDSHRVNLQFHNMLQLKNGTRVKLTFCKELIATDHECDSHYLKSMTIFDSKGCMHSCQVTFCRCLSEMENLVRIGFWPSSAVDPICALSMQLLNWISNFVMETQSSVKSICHSLKWIHRMTEKDATFMYRTLMNETLEEFRHFSFMVSSLNSEAPCLDDGTSCPACPKTDGDAFISLDANFGLVRKKNAGQSLEPPKHSSRYFIDQDESDAFVNSYHDHEVSKDESEECSNFQAINTIRAKNKIANLDSKGVFGSACRHGIPKLFVSMRHGERYAYPVLLLQKMVAGSTLNYHIIYDIACKFEAHVKKNLPELSGIDIALPVFHAYGHKLPCQVLYSTRWKEGYGLTDGECMERLWSYLRKFAPLTKEMTPSHRIDLLSDALLHFTAGKISQIGTTLSMALLKGRDIVGQSLHELDATCSDFNVTHEVIRKWRADEKHLLTAKQHASKKQKASWKDQYVKNLDLHHHLSLELAVCEDPDQIVLLNAHLRQTQDVLNSIELKNAINARWNRDSQEYTDAAQNMNMRKEKTLKGKLRNQVVEYMYLKEISKKYSAGQAIAQRVAKQLRRSTKLIRSTMNSYNKELPSKQSAVFAECVDPNSSFYSIIADVECEDPCIPQGIKRKAIDALNMFERATEEERALLKEMDNTVQFFDHEISLLETECSQQAKVTSRTSDGVQCLLREKKLHYTELKNVCVSLFDQARMGSIDLLETDVYLSDDDEEEKEDDDSSE